MHFQTYSSLCIDLCNNTGWNVGFLKKTTTGIDRESPHFTGIDLNFECTCVYTECYKAALARGSSALLSVLFRQVFMLCVLN